MLSKPEIQPRPLRAMSRGPLLAPSSSYQLVDENADEDEVELQKPPPLLQPHQTRQLSAPSAVMKSVTIAVEYSSSTADHHRESMLVYDPNWLPTNSRAWKGTEEETSLCLDVMSLSNFSLAGLKCQAPREKESLRYNHSVRCFSNLFKNMEQIDCKTALMRLQTLQLDQLHANLTKSIDTLLADETRLELELWVSALLESRHLQRFCSTRSKGSLISYDRTEILDLDSTIGQFHSL
jgi:hypothetical protein